MPFHPCLSHDRRAKTHIFTFQKQFYGGTFIRPSLKSTILSVQAFNLKMTVLIFRYDDEFGIGELSITAQ